MLRAGETSREATSRWRGTLEPRAVPKTGSRRRRRARRGARSRPYPRSRRIASIIQTTQVQTLLEDVAARLRLRRLEEGDAAMRDPAALAALVSVLLYGGRARGGGPGSAR